MKNIFRNQTMEDKFDGFGDLLSFNAKRGRRVSQVLKGKNLLKKIIENPKTPEARECALRTLQRIETAEEQFRRNL